LIVAEEAKLNAYDGRTGAAMTGWKAPDLTGRRFFRGTVAGGRFALIVSSHSPPPWRNWLVGKRILLYKYFQGGRVALRLYDARTGREAATIWTKDPSDFRASPDGGMLATFQTDNPFDRDGNIFLWDIPPRTPGGIVPRPDDRRSRPAHRLDGLAAALVPEPKCNHKSLINNSLCRFTS
jgi:hypothetical protein